MQYIAVTVRFSCLHACLPACLPELYFGYNVHTFTPQKGMGEGYLRSVYRFGFLCLPPPSSTVLSVYLPHPGSALPQVSLRSVPALPPLFGLVVATVVVVVVVVVCLSICSLFSLVFHLLRKRHFLSSSYTVCLDTCLCLILSPMGWPCPVRRCPGRNRGTVRTRRVRRGFPSRPTGACPKSPPVIRHEGFQPVHF